ncbi:MAG: hypothetical protein R3E08_01525 [Thiotrichaceae bacterium]
MPNAGGGKKKDSDAVETNFSLIIELEQADCNSDSYNFRAWFGHYSSSGSSLPVYHLGKYGKKDLPSVIGKIANALFINKRDICDDSFTIEFFLPKELLCESIEQWIIDAELDEKLGNCYKLVIRSVERFRDGNMLRRLTNCWRKNQGILQAVPKEKCCHWSNASDHKEVTKLLLSDQPDDRKVFFVLDDFSSEVKSIFTLIRYGVPFLLWPTDANHNCSQASEKLLSSCKTFEQLPKELRELRSRDGISNVSLLWDNPEHIPPFSEFSGRYEPPS